MNKNKNKNKNNNNKRKSETTENLRKLIFINSRQTNVKYKIHRNKIKIVKLKKCKTNKN